MHFLSRTLKLGQVAGINIEIDYSWFIIFVLVFLTLTFDFFPAVDNFGWLINIILGLVTTLLFFTSVLSHELAHSIIANRHALKIKKITLFIFGGVASLSREPEEPSIELKVALAGPILSLLLSITFFGLSLLIELFWLPLAVALQYLSIINLALALFNLLPGYPLDGGRVLRALLSFKMNYLKATMIAGRFGQAVGVLLILYGIFQFVYFGNLFGLVWLSLIGYFLISAAKESMAQTIYLETLKKVKVQEVMSRSVILIPASLNLRVFLEKYVLGLKKTNVFVIEKQKIIGQITLRQIKRIKTHNLEKSSVKNIMQKFNKNCYLKPNISVAQALEHLGNDYEQLPVILKGKLLGLLNRENIRLYLAVRPKLIVKS